jgi:hypothetical protein
MHKGIDALVTIARANANAEERTEALQTAIFEYFVKGLSDHGFEADRDRMWSILNIDVKLNTQGIEVWLDRQK